MLKKEFRQIFRNQMILRMIIAMPILQLLIMPMAADFEIKNINVAIVDKDNSSYSRRLIDKILASGYFKITELNKSIGPAFESFEKDESDLIIEIPKDFESDYFNWQKSKLYIAVNAINGTKATVGNAYLSKVISQFNSDIRIEKLHTPRMPQESVISVESSNWFNPFLNYPFYMVPGILVTLVTMVGTYMCALNIVKEKEIGTIEQINVTPIKKHIFILGKLIPFWIIGFIIFNIGLFGVARLVYGIIPAGSILLLYGFLSIYLIALLGVGLLISTYSETQQQAMSLAFFAMMIFMLLSGLFTSIESMPEWAIWIARCNPVTYFIEVMRMVVMKGSTFSDIKIHFVIITSMALFFNSWAILNYKKTT